MKKNIEHLQENNEIKALLNLIEDPDQEVFSSISNKLVSLGKQIIPNLEKKWEEETDEHTQERIEMLIHKLHFNELSFEFDAWNKDETSNLLGGALIVAKFHYPEIQANLVLLQIEKLRRNIWLELNHYLTPIEKINVFNSILYNYHQQKGTEIIYDKPDLFLINKTLESKKGNGIGNGILYLILCNLLDIPVSAIRIHKYFLLAFCEDQIDLIHHNTEDLKKISFFIDPINGQMYTKNEILNYLIKNVESFEVNELQLMNNKEVIKFLLLELSKCFDDLPNQYKKEELQLLAKKLDL